MSLPIKPRKDKTTNKHMEQLLEFQHCIIGLSTIAKLAAATQYLHNNEMVKLAFNGESMYPCCPNAPTAVADFIFADLLEHEQLIAEMETSILQATAHNNTPVKSSTLRVAELA